MRKYLVPLLLLAMLGINVAKNYLDGGLTFTTSKNLEDGRILRWGLVKRDGGRPPDVDPGTPELLKRYKSIYMGDKSKNIIYLTFDEGYENGFTPKILDVLKENKVKAVFFITGHFLKDNQALVKRMVDEGHEVGNHTMMHKSMPEISDNEIKKDINDLDLAFFELTGKHTKFLRAPKGEYSERTLKISSEMGYYNVFWSFAYDDWLRDKVRGSDYAYNAVVKYLHNGEIILLHAVSSDNAGALDRIIKDARLKGFEFGDLNDLYSGGQPNEIR
jgi:peptidoglycan-N-acetylmuramic acid deacetylase